MFSHIASLRNKGFNPTHIFDVGAHHGNWTNSCSDIFPTAKYYMFEAIDYTELQKYKQYSNIKVCNEVLNDKIETVTWYEMRNEGDSMFKEKTQHFSNCNEILRQTNTLNNCVNQYNIKINTNESVLIKIDCQGAEIPILKGASELLANTDFIILEVPMFGQYNENVPSFLEHIQYMDSIGYITYDIVDHHYVENFNIQVDVLFIKKTHALCTTVQQMLLHKMIL